MRIGFLIVQLRIKQLILTEVLDTIHIKFYLTFYMKRLIIIILFILNGELSERVNMEVVDNILTFGSRPLKQP